MAPTPGADALALHPDRGFDPDPAVRRAARELYEGIRQLPIVSPHGHVDPRIFVADAPFPSPAALLITPDHYVLRMLHSQGVSLQALGVARRDGSSDSADPRAIWQLLAERFHLFLGTPSGYWLEHELHELFDVRLRLNASTAMPIYDQVAERLASPEFRPRALFERFNIEVLATTDAAHDPLDHHRAIRESGWSGRVIPTFRPDAVFRIAAPGWGRALELLAAADNSRITTWLELLAVLHRRRAYFQQHGATATDHGVVAPYTLSLPVGEMELIFQRGQSDTASMEDQRQFEGQLLLEMARMSLEDGLVMQLHAGAMRDHDAPLAEQFGADRGGDIPVAVEWTRNLRPLLNAHGNDPRLTLILFTLDETSYARELAPLAGHYSAVRLGAPWWFHDSMEGIRRFREATTETAGIWNTAGFNDDTRAFCSIPARHDLARRVDANYLGGLVARHVIGMGDAHRMARAMTYDLARESYRLGQAQ
jgi:glucuronate isomerase